MIPAFHDYHLEPKITKSGTTCNCFLMLSSKRRFSNPAYQNSGSNSNWYWTNLKKAIFWFTLTGSLFNMYPSTSKSKVIYPKYFKDYCTRNIITLGLYACIIPVLKTICLLLRAVCNQEWGYYQGPCCR